MNELGSSCISNRLMFEVALDPLRLSLDAAQVLGSGLDGSHSMLPLLTNNVPNLPELLRTSNLMSL
jgi:hypothetical protein